MHWAPRGQGASATPLLSWTRIPQPLPGEQEERPLIQLQGSGSPSTQEDRSPSNVQRTADDHRKLRGSKGRNGVEGVGPQEGQEQGSFDREPLQLRRDSVC